MADVTAHADVTFGGTATGNVSFVTWETTAGVKFRQNLKRLSAFSIAPTFSHALTDWLGRPKIMLVPLNTRRRPRMSRPAV